MLICPQCGKENPDGFRFCGFCTVALSEAPVAREQRRTVTVLFCDLVNSTAMAESTDPEALRALLARYFDKTKTIIERHGGSVEKFIGDAVMAIFGVPAVHEDDALRALRAGVEIRAALPGFGVEGRIGVSTGEVVTGTEERLATGDAVNVAARLQQVAEPGEILITEATYRLTRDAVQTESLGLLSLKGKAEPLPAYRLLSVHEAGFARRFAAPMVGRETELRRLRDAFDQTVRDRSCQLFTILGAAGVGKSRLAAEFLASLADTTVVRGRCLPYGEGITYWPVVEVVKQLPEVGTGPTPARTIKALMSDEQVGTSSEEIAWAFRKLLEAAASDTPLVCVFDDLHWGEESFLDLVDHVADLSRDAAILQLCMARPELLERRPAWAGGKVNATNVLLPPLAPEETARLIEGLAHLEHDLGERITQSAEGNPLFVEQMVALALESGEGEVSVPPTIQALLAARVDQLDPGERDVLQCGSVEGRVFHLGCVQALASEPAQTNARLTSLVRKEFIRPDSGHFHGEDAYRFRHLLIRDAAYDSISKRDRADLHERFGRWLERNAGDRATEYEEVVGYHFEQACRYRTELGAVDDGLRALARETARRLGAAGRRAFIRSDASAGVNLVSRAVALLAPSDPLRVDLVPNVRVVQGMSADTSWAKRVLDEAIAAATEAGDQRLVAQALVQGGFLRLFTAPDVAPAELFDVAERVIPVFAEHADELGLARAWRLVAQAHYLDRRAQLCAEASERALGHAVAASDRFEQREIQEWLVSAHLWGPTPAREAVTRFERLLEQSRGDAVQESQLLGALALASTMAGRISEAREFASRARCILHERGEGVWIISADLAQASLRRGELADAEAEIRPKYELLTEMGTRSHLSPIAQILADVVYDDGRFEEAERLSLECEQAAGANDIFDQVRWRAIRAKVLARRGEFESAQDLAAEAIGIAETSDFLVAHAHALLDLAEVLGLAGRLEAGTAAIGEAISLFERKGYVLGVERARTRLRELQHPSASPG